MKYRIETRIDLSLPGLFYTETATYEEAVKACDFLRDHYRRHNLRATACAVDIQSKLIVHTS